jgi:hypothetical protein
MVSNCANPKCNASFKYFGTGQLFISKAPDSPTTSWQQELQWLCGSCASNFAFHEFRPVAHISSSTLAEKIPSLPDQIGEHDVLLDCANSACSAIFISPNQGKLFKFNTSRQARAGGENAFADKQPASADRESWFWLCDGCSKHMTVRMVRGHAEAVPLRHSMAA